MRLDIRITTSIVIAVVVLMFAGSARAQYNNEVNPFPVAVAGDTLGYPFWGGINNPKPSLVDFDGDSLIDLFIGESSGKLNYLRNTGTPNSPVWTPVTERFAGLDIGSWHRLVDIDDDGDLDILCDNISNGVVFYRNQSVGSNIIFVEADSVFGGITTGVNNTPALTDIDNDGDLDFFVGDPGGQLVFYRNVGNSTTPLFTLISTFYDSILAFPGGGGGLGKITEPLHGFSAINFADIDSDGDDDLIWGDLFNTNLYLFGNLGTATVSDLTYLTDTYLSPSYSTLGFNHAPLADVDDDGDLDMVMAPANGEFVDNLKFLRNTGTAAAANFVLEQQNLIDEIDVGRSAFPDLADIDGDGDLDLFIGGGDGQIAFYRNVGTRAQASYSRVTTAFASIDVGFTAIPAFVDWDADGDLDLLVGNENGFIQHWRNDGSECSPLFVNVTNQLAGIKVDQLAVPVPVDLDKDGLIDLVVGEWDFNGSANVLLYENTGTAGSPVLTLVTKFLIKKQARDFTIPAAADWDEDGKIDLIIGNRLLGLTFYRNTAAMGSFPDSLTLLAQVGSIPGDDVGGRAALTRGDIDSDGDLDIVVGEEDGGVNFFRKSGGTTYQAGDADGNAIITISDAVYLINFIFAGGPAPSPTLDGDADCNGIITISDAVFLINFIFAGGPAPCATCSGS